MFSIRQKLFLAKVIVGIFICSTAIFLALYISLMTQYNLAVEMLREHLKIIHHTETHNYDIKKYLADKENDELNIFKAIKEIKEIHENHDKEHKHYEKTQENNIKLKN